MMHKALWGTLIMSTDAAYTRNDLASGRIFDFSFTTLPSCSLHAWPFCSSLNMVSCLRMCMLAVPSLHTPSHDSLPTLTWVCESIISFYASIFITVKHMWSSEIVIPPVADSHPYTSLSQKVVHSPGCIWEVLEFKTFWCFENLCIFKGVWENHCDLAVKCT